MSADAEFMFLAIRLATKGLGHTYPNPPVGAVIVKDGEIVGRGWHKRAGCDHAEVAALKAAKGRTEGATVYVTMEPCSRPGRVGACTDALIAAKVAKVVYAVPDPNPVNRGRAEKVLRKAGISCKQIRDKLVRYEALHLIAPFAKRVLTGLPVVMVKIAMSLDGKICDDYGDAKWISSAKMRKETDKMREIADAIMVGGETVRRDNPSLLPHGKRNDDLIRVIVSKSGNLPKNAQVFTDGAPNKTLVFDDARKAIEELARMGVTIVLCEGGMKLAVSLAEAGLVSVWQTVLCPKVIGTKHVADATKVGMLPCLQDS